MKEKVKSRLRDSSYAEYTKSQLFDWLEHISNKKCQRCGCKKGPFIIVDLDVLHSKKDNPMELPTLCPCFSTIYICKKYHDAHFQWLNIPFLD